ncbi:DUF4430 domain-containing protein [Ihubacter sp. mB4P-1]|uniref:DUF4430 domain-containing protein n=1 Tax=Ihubacter sp. mB4P-1 TaxID=3242370 RepID=UPI003C7BF1F7
MDGKTYTGTSENSTRVLIKPEITPPVMPDNFIREDRTETYEEGQIVGKIGPYIGAHGSFNEMEETHQWYQSVDGETFEKAEGDDATQRYYQPKLNGIGKMYYKCEVTYTSTTSGLSTTETTARICVEITERNKQSFEELNGAGTKASPWEINNLTDLLKLQQKVNDEGISFAGCHFKLMADITLPADWTPIGNENYNRPFSGTIHGNEKTITVEKGGKPLLGFVRAAAVNDLKIYGEEIHGYGLVNNYKIDYGSSGNYADLDNSFYTIRINNVTLKEGSKTLKAGFIGGEASGMNFVEISNSTIEKGVVIGYDKKQSDIGSFAGAFNGRVINCVSYADVYGVKNVGGLVGNKGQAMGTCAIIGSQFQGTVTASGNYVGGILGSGYDGNGTAPNTPTVTVKDCHVTGTVTGKDYVGGILGGEPGVEECWANGIGRIQNNLFTGAIQSSGTRMGAIIGYLQSLNRYMIISGNYYEETCGAEKGIGTIAKVDKNTDGRYYRDDDPLGVDAEKLTKKANATQLSDGSITKALNEGRDSSGNWEQGKNTPVRGNRNYVIAISLSGGTSKFTTNDTFSTEGMEASLIYCDGTEEAVDISEVKFSGYDLSKTGYQTVTAEYKNYTIVYEIEVRQGLKPGEEEKTITVKFKLVGDKVHGAEETHTMRDQNLITWIDTEEYVVPANSYVIDVFATALEKHGFSWYNQNVYNGKDGNYIQKIIAPAPFNVELEENGNGSANSGWMYTLNGDYPLLGVSEQRLSDGATIVFHYTDDYTKETASDKWNPPTVDPENPGDTDIDDPNTPLDPGPEVVKGMVSKMKLTARSTRTSKKNVKVTVKADKTTTDGIKELQDMGYTVKYRYYRSTKKASGYKAALTKKTKTYTNTIGKKGQMYYYKVSLRVYDKNGKLVAKTALKQCKYANRLWTKK